MFSHKGSGGLYLLKTTKIPTGSLKDGLSQTLRTTPTAAIVSAAGGAFVSHRNSRRRNSIGAYRIPTMTLVEFA